MKISLFFFNQGVQPQALAELLQFALENGLISSPKNVKWLLLQADLHMSSPNPDPRTVLSLILQAASIATDYFAQSVPPSVFTERVSSCLLPKMHLLCLLPTFFLLIDGIRNGSELSISGLHG